MSDTPHEAQAVDAPRCWGFRRMLVVWAMAALTLQLFMLLFVSIPKGNEAPFATLAWIFAAIVLAFFGNSGAVEWIARRGERRP